MPPFAALPRTAVHAWCPASLQRQSGTAEPLLVTGTVSGALDDSFSTDSQLELWAPFSTPSSAETPRTPIASVQLNARFNRLAWGTHSHSGHTPLGVVAAGLDDGGVSLWDPAKLLRDGHASSAPSSDPLIARLESPHRGPVRGLDFSPAQSNLLATGATNGEVSTRLSFSDLCSVSRRRETGCPIPARARRDQTPPSLPHTSLNYILPAFRTPMTDLHLGPDVPRQAILTRNPVPLARQHHLARVEPFRRPHPRLVEQHGSHGRLGLEVEA